MPEPIKKLHVLISLERGELSAQCIELNVQASAQTFASLQRSFYLNFTSKVLLNKGLTEDESPSATTRIPVPRNFRDQYKNAKPLADLMRIGKFVIEFAVI